MPKLLNDLLKNLKNAKNNPLPALIDEYVLTREKAPNRLREYKIDMIPRERPSGRFGASSVGGCKRLAMYKFLGIPGKNKTDPQLELKFEDGNWRHHKWQAIFLDMEQVLGSDRFKVIGIEKQIKIPQLNIVGHYDIAVDIEDFGEVVIDLKGINDRGFTYIIRNQKPKEQHIAQIVSYEKGSGIDKGIIIYDNKNDQSTKMCLVEYDNMIWLDIQAWCDDVLEYIEKRRLPKKHPDCNQGVYLWSKCPFAHLCFGNHEEEIVEKYIFQDKWRKNGR